MKAQFELLTNQYDDNLTKIAACAARHDIGILYFASILLLFLSLSFHVCQPSHSVDSRNVVSQFVAF